MQACGIRPWCALALLLLVLPREGAAQSGGVALRWDTCFGEAAGTSIRSFACDTNSGFEELVGSFSVPEDMVDLVGIEVVIDIWTYGGPAQTPTGAPLPAWWEFVNVGSCRRNSVSVTAAPDPSDFNCMPLWSSSVVATIAAYPLGVWGPGTARVLLFVAVPSDALTGVNAGSEYDAFTLRIRHDNTVGADACAGCNVPMMIILRSISVVPQGGVNVRILTTPLGVDWSGVDSQHAFWTPVPVSTHRSTWGSVKSLYR